MPQVHRASQKPCRGCLDYRHLNAYTKNPALWEGRYPWCRDCVDRLSRLVGPERTEEMKRYRKDYNQSYQRNYQKVLREQDRGEKSTEASGGTRLPDMSKIRSTSWMSRFMQHYDQIEGSTEARQMKDQQWDLHKGRCIECESKRRVELHRIYPVNTYPELMFAPSNASMWCNECWSNHLEAGGVWLDLPLDIVDVGNELVSSYKMLIKVMAQVVGKRGKGAERLGGDQPMDEEVDDG